MRHLLFALYVLLVLLIFSVPANLRIRPVWADVNFGTLTVPTVKESAGYLLLNKATLSTSGTLFTISFYCLVSGNVKVGIYADSSGSPGALVAGPITQSSCAAGQWNTVSAPSTSLTAGDYWLAGISDTPGALGEGASGTMRYTPFSYGGTWPNPAGSGYSPYSVVDSIYATVSTGPPPPPPSDFTITATTPSQIVGAGATATYTLTITYSSTLTATVNLAVTSGCPAGVTCTLTPNSVTGSNTVTLSVPTLITTPGGTTTITVTASSTSPTLSHSVSVQLTVNSPGSYGVNVHAGATQVVVTISWTGSGTASVTLVGPGGSSTLSESGAIVYDRVTYVSGSSSPTNIHRATFTISPPGLAQAWTVLVSLSGSYTVTIEVS